METLLELGLREVDVHMLITCPVAALLGGIIHALKIYHDFSTPPVLVEIKTPSFSGRWKEVLRRGGGKIYIVFVSIFRSMIHPSFLIYKLLFSILTGLAVGVFFIGIFPDELHGKSRIWVLCIAVGYGPHVIWTAQERWARSLEKSKNNKERLTQVIPSEVDKEEH